MDSLEKTIDTVTRANRKRSEKRVYVQWVNGHQISLKNIEAQTNNILKFQVPKLLGDYRPNPSDKAYFDQGSWQLNSMKLAPIRHLRDPQQLHSHSSIITNLKS